MPPTQVTNSRFKYYSQISIASLKYRLRQRCRSTKGQKQQLIVRLLRSDQRLRGRLPFPDRIVSFAGTTSAVLVALCRSRKLDTDGDRSTLAQRIALYDAEFDRKLWGDGSHGHPTKPIPFQDGAGWGRDPAEFVGKSITAYEDRECPLSALTLWCGWDVRDALQFLINMGSEAQGSESQYLFDFTIKMDEVLSDALELGLGARKPHHGGPRVKKDKDGKEKSLLIIDAGVAMRRWTAERQEYRVVGIRLEGMEQMGFLWAEDEDESWTKGESERTRFGNLFLPLKYW